MKRLSETLEQEPAAIPSLEHSHIALVYDNEIERHQAVADYLNEGLKKGQLCYYCSVYNRDEDHLTKLAPLIVDYEENVKSGNLVIVDFAPFYIAAVCGDLSPFEQVADKIEQAVKSRGDKHARLVGDCVCFLFKNKHFDECAKLEAWWQENPFIGAYLCPYPRSDLERFPHKMHLKNAIQDHDIVIDAHGNILVEYMNQKDKSVSGKHDREEDRKAP